MDENVKRIIDAFAAITPQAWQTLVDFHRADAVTGVLMSLATTMMFGCLALWGKRSLKDARVGYDDVTGYTLAIIFGSGLALVFLAVALDCTLAAIYPEGALIKTLVYKAVGK